jgi:NAD(P)-dependent dehydrogenase (short-subunit alcohol dehydrogenase family)
VIRFSSAGWRVLTCSRHPFPEDVHGAPGLRPSGTSPIMTTPRGRFRNGQRLETANCTLVNNAAISPKMKRGWVDRYRHRDLGHVFRVNFFAPIMMARGLIEELKAAKGSVVNVTSIAGSRVHPFAGAAYATSKAALASLTREMASDFGRIGVRVNSIAPGEIDTSILSPGTEKIVEQQIPLRRLGTPDEVAKIIYVLCTETSSYVNGAEIHINGGQHV